VLSEVLPKAGLVVSEKGSLTEILCKPKLLPLKSITLQKLEEIEVGCTHRVVELRAALREKRTLCCIHP
jgi:BBSome-interacting protein 1